VADLEVAAEEDRRIRAIEGIDARIRAPRAVPGEAAGNFVGDLPKAPAQIVLPVDIPVAQVDSLNLWRDARVAKRR